MERDDNLRSGMAKRQKKNLASLHLIPIDVLVEIFLRLPAKSLARFVGVSNICASIIRGRHFIRSYSSRFSEPRFVFAATKEIMNFNEEWYFFSKPTLVRTPLCPVPKPGMVEWVKLTQRVSCRNKKSKDLALVETPPDFVSRTVCHSNQMRNHKPCYAHGLVMFLHGDDQVVTNPSTGKSITLPAVKTSHVVIKSFLGYDPTNAQHKVLCFTKGKGFYQHQVLTLGRGKNCSWRTVQCSIVPHSPWEDSVCIDGVLYYVASTVKEFLVVGFDLRSETFEIVSVFPKGVEYGKCTTLINYHGKAALAVRYYRKVFGLWVLEDTKKPVRWSQEYICLPPITGIYKFDFEILGASELGEIIFAPVEFDEYYFYFLDRKSNQIRLVDLEGSTEHKFRDFKKVFTFWPYVECVMLI